MKPPRPARAPARLPVLVLALVALGLVGAGCGGDGEGGAAAAGAGAPPPARGAAAPIGDAEREVRDLVNAATPPAPDATAIARDDWFRRRREAVERLRQGGPEIGRTALQAFRNGETRPPEVRVALLDVAAHAAPEETRPVLEELFGTYGVDLSLRRHAIELLARTSPETALPLLAPLLTDPDKEATYPPAESLLAAWLVAAEKLGAPREEVLADVATDVRQDPAARHLAVRQLGRTPGPVGRQALETVLVESLGDDLIRRLAAQSLRDTLPREEFCALMKRTLEREASETMIPFLADMVETNCR